ncbi:MAG: protein translocase subunit SecF [Longimicrobiales bacterium]
MRLFENANYDFIGKRRLTYMVVLGVALFALLPGLVFQLSSRGWFNWGVDFTGGTLVQVSFTQPMTVAELRGVVEPIAPGAAISDFGDKNEFLIRAQNAAGAATTGIADQIDQTLRARYGANYTKGRTEAVGPKVGSELQTRATIAVLLSFAATLIYLAFRLEWTFGVAAIAATISDILFTLGVLATFRHLEFSLTTVAALLTIIGYSLNDKIVVFDRVRENLKVRRREEFAPLINRSVNETLPRTVMTGGSVIAVLAVLFLVGGIAIRDFALIMFLGIVVGTFSSMFLAPVVLIEINKRWGDRAKVKNSKPARAGAAD